MNWLFRCLGGKRGMPEVTELCLFGKIMYFDFTTQSDTTQLNQSHLRRYMGM